MDYLSATRKGRLAAWAGAPRRSIFSGSLSLAILLLPLAPGLCAPGSASATTESAAADGAVQSTINQIRATINAEKGKISETELQKKIEAVLRPLFDFSEMAKSSLGANWSKATPQEQSEFVELFTELLAQSYLKKIRENIEVSEITFQEPVARDATVVVKSTVSSKGDEFPIDYRMRLTEGRWRVYDVVVENVGLISNYRNEFTTIVRKEQMSGLLLRLREKLAKTKQG